MEEAGFGGMAALDESNAGNWHLHRQFDSQFMQCFERVRHEAFAAAFVDRLRLGDSFEHRDAEAFAARGDGGGETGGSCSGNGNVDFHHRNNTNSEKKPGPIAASNP